MPDKRKRLGLTGTSSRLPEEGGRECGGRTFLTLKGDNELRATGAMTKRTRLSRGKRARRKKRGNPCMSGKKKKLRCKRGLRKKSPSESQRENKPRRKGGCCFLGKAKKGKRGLPKKKIRKEKLCNQARQGESRGKGGGGKSTNHQVKSLNKEAYKRD